MKTAVLGDVDERGIVYNAELLDLAAHYGFVPKTCKQPSARAQQVDVPSCGSPPARQRCRRIRSKHLASSSRLDSWIRWLAMKPSRQSAGSLPSQPIKSVFLSRPSTAYSEPLSHHPEIRYEPAGSSWRLS
jgi:hypothetical protein